MGALLPCRLSASGRKRKEKVLFDCPLEGSVFKVTAIKEKKAVNKLLMCIVRGPHVPGLSDDPAPENKR